jgi:signal transduction histidine kinase
VNIRIPLQLFVFTAGTLLSFFWIAVILGHRRQRSFERVLFFLCLSLFQFYSGLLLALNSQLHYANTPGGLLQFSWLLICLGLTALPSLLLHLQVEYASVRGMLSDQSKKTLWLIGSYLPLLYFVPKLFVQVRLTAGFDFQAPINGLGVPYKLWLAVAFVVSAVWQRKFAAQTSESEEKSFHKHLVWQLALAAFWVCLIHAERNGMEGTVNLFLVAFPLLPLGTLIRKVQKFNFLQIGRQSNLIYAVVLAFVALLYLSFVRRVSQWFEPTFPPEATAAVLLFLPVVFFEPLQRAFRNTLRKTAHSEMDLTQRMMGPIQDVARLGNFAKLVQFVEQWVKSQFQLAKVELLIGATAKQHGGSGGSGGGAVDTFTIRQGKHAVGHLRVTSHGAMLSGETWAALEFLCEQLPSAFDLCRLIEEKLRLERELAERERMAALGQMAASISHNLKNPLGSIKTILQVQMESPEMPEQLKAETRMVLGEISRLSNKLGQLLQFSRPTVLGESNAVFVLDEVVNEVGAVMRPEAERKGITLQLTAENGLCAMASREAVSDIVSNLVVNGLEAASSGGHVMVSLARRDRRGLICVQDDGKGIPAELREKVMQPFFTTKTQGTGLGLAIVARRVSEAGGKVELESPVADGRGTKFSVWLPLQKNEVTK